jgi:hypothetical protein
MRRKAKQAIGRLEHKVTVMNRPDPNGSTLARLRKNQRGMALAFVGVGLMALMGVTILSVDVGMLVTARNQAQNSADAGAFAGALSLVFDDWNDRSAGGPAVQNALAAGRANEVMSRMVSVAPGDVTFPNDPAGNPNRVRVQVFRTGGRANPVSTLVAQFFGIPTADISAFATGEAAPSNAQTCVKPFTIPDKWIEMQTPPWDMTDTFDMYNNHGQLIANPDIYVPSSQSGYTGYDATDDKGTLIRIKTANGNNISPSFYFPFRVGSSNGADDYRWNIENCNTTRMTYGDLPDSEPGNMSGPTVQGVEALVLQDSAAYWDSTHNRPMSSYHPSPRVGIIPVFDPIYWEQGKQTGNNAALKIVNFIGIFILGMEGNDVIARITPVTGLIEGGYGPAPMGAFPKTVRLVE